MITFTVSPDAAGQRLDKLVRKALRDVPLSHVYKMFRTRKIRVNGARGRAEQLVAEEIAGRARGTPRVANRLLRRVRDFAEVRDRGVIDRDVATEGLGMLEVDGAGLDRHDRQFLQTIAGKFGGGPASPPSPSRLARRPTRSRTSSSHTCSSRDWSSGPRGAGCSPSGPMNTWVFPSRRGWRASFSLAPV